MDEDIALRVNHLSVETMLIAHAHDRQSRLLELFFPHTVISGGRLQIGEHLRRFATKSVLVHKAI
jgi:hypothetical protein